MREVMQVLRSQCKTDAHTLPGLFTLQELSVRSDLQLQGQLGIHQSLQLHKHALHLGSELAGLLLQRVDLKDMLMFLLFQLSQEILVLLLQLGILGKWFWQSYWQNLHGVSGRHSRSKKKK